MGSTHGCRCHFRHNNEADPGAGPLPGGGGLVGLHMAAASQHVGGRQPLWVASTRRSKEGVLSPLRFQTEDYEFDSLPALLNSTRYAICTLHC